MIYFELNNVQNSMLLQKKNTGYLLFLIYLFILKEAFGLKIWELFLLMSKSN